MTPVPPPEKPCVRCALTYTNSDGTEAGSRIYLSYGGSAPTGANCQAIASGVLEAFHTEILGNLASTWALTEVDVLDIATDTGLSGQATADYSGAESGHLTPANVATNVEFGIARRYRGGKPRMYLPPGMAEVLQDDSHWDDAFVTQCQTGVEAAFTTINALTVGAVGPFRHVNLSYYSGYDTATPPWRGPGHPYPPKYRDQALVDDVTGYFVKKVVGSQRRRRTSTTP